MLLLLMIPLPTAAPTTTPTTRTTKKSNPSLLRMNETEIYEKDIKILVSLDELSFYLFTQIIIYGGHLYRNEMVVVALRCGVVMLLRGIH